MKSNIKSNKNIDTLKFSDEIQLCLGLMHINHVYLTLSKHFQRSHGLNITQFTLLRLIETYPGITLTRLKTIVNLPTGSVSLSIIKLIEKGVVVKMFDRKDGRRLRLYLSPKGTSIARKLLTEFKASINKAADIIHDSFPTTFFNSKDRKRPTVSA